MIRTTLNIAPKRVLFAYANSAPEIHTHEIAFLVIRGDLISTPPHD